MSTSDSNRRGSQDRSGDEPEIVEVSYIVLEYDVSEDEANEALQRVGNRSSDIEGYFRDRGRQRTGRGRSGQQGRTGERDNQRQSTGGQQSGSTGSRGQSGRMDQTSSQGGRMDESSSGSQSERSEGSGGTQNTSGQQSGSSGQQGKKGDSGRGSSGNMG